MATCLFRSPLAFRLQAFLEGKLGALGIAAEIEGARGDRQGERVLASLDVRDPFLVKALQLAVDNVEPQRIEELMRHAEKREAKELRQANEILRLASAFFAQAELDRLKKK